MHVARKPVLTFTQQARPARAHPSSPMKTLSFGRDRIDNNLNEKGRRQRGARGGRDTPSDVDPEEEAALRPGRDELPGGDALDPLESYSHAATGPSPVLSGDALHEPAPQGDDVAPGEPSFDELLARAVASGS